MIGDYAPAYKSRRFWLAESVFFQLKKYAVYIQSLMLAVFLLFIVLPLISPTPKSSDTILTSVVLLSQFMLWGVWYGACLLSVIPFGRLWCGVLCPLGAMSQWVSVFGLNKTLPRWVKWDGWLIIMFVAVTILGQTMDVRDDPKGVLKIFATMFALAIVLGVLYGKNSSRPWCRYFCPIGKILGIVARLSIIDFRSNKGPKPLPPGQDHYVQGRLCPTDYNLPYKVSNNNCIACSRCTFKQSNSGMGVYKRSAGAEVEQVMSCDPSWTEVFFILLSPGLSAGGFLWLILHQYQQMRDAIGAWAIDNQVMWLFNQASSAISSQTWNQHFNNLDVLSIVLYMLIYGVGFAIIFSSLLAIASYSLSSKYYSFKRTFMLLAYQFTPLAILSIVIGLCGKFFETMQHDFSMPVIASTIIQASLFLISAFWTVSLLRKSAALLRPGQVRRHCIAWLMFILLLILLVLLWYPAIFHYSYMSEVELIRKHIVLP